MILKSIRLKNFRCFENTGDIELKPLTIFVGANSSGKSSILKFFPFLKQSIKAEGDNAFNWGEDVDFYDYKNTVINNDIEKTIEVDFVFLQNDNGTFTVSETIAYNKESKIDYIDTLLLKSKDENVEFSLNMYYTKGELYYEQIINGTKDSLKDDIRGEVTKKNNLIRGIPSKGKFLPLLSRFDALIETAATEFDWFAKNIYYIKPLRMDIQRRYNTTVAANTSSLYSDASNLAYYLNKLNSIDKDDLNKWLEVNDIDIYIDFEKLSANINVGILEICIKTNGMKESRNIVDLGFGFSQILPIVVLMWSSIRQVNKTGYRDNQHSVIVAIEQPEVHLHPKYIGKFASLVAKTIKLCKANKLPINFIVETHSDAFLNKVGDIIRDKQLQGDDVNLLIFNPNETGVSDIIPVRYDDDGIPEDWPIDFFYVD